MKSQSFQLLAFLTLISFIRSYPATNPCKWTDPETKNSYDFSGLSKPDGWKITDINLAEEDFFKIVVFFSFCTPLNTGCNGKSNLAVYEALEVEGQVTDTCEVIGSLDQMDVVTGASQGFDGVKITFKGGENCLGSDNPAQNGNPMLATFNIFCSENADSNFQQIPFNGDSRTKCNPEFHINHPAGCIGGGHGSTSGFWKFIIFALIVYIIGAVIYNVKIENRKGVEAIPHIALWRRVRDYLKNYFAILKKHVDQILQKFRKGHIGSVTGGLASNAKLTSGSKSGKYTLV